MLYALISDVHSNIEALNAVLEEIDRLNIKNIISAGDIIGYGPCPEECVKTFIEKNIPAVLGNHEALMNRTLSRKNIRAEALEAIAMNYAAMSENSRQYIKRLKTHMTLDELTVAHARPPGDFIGYLFYSEETYDSFRDMEKDICVIGHTHEPLIFKYHKNKPKKILSKKIELKKDSKYILNPGSVGQPRDYNNKASFAVLTDDSFEIKRVKYDIQKTVAAMKDKGYPESLYKRLRKGE